MEPRDQHQILTTRRQFFGDVGLRFGGVAMAMPMAQRGALADPGPGATLSFYLSGTSTPASVYTTSDLSVAHPNPLPVGSGAASPNIYVAPDVSYRVVVKNAAGDTIDDIDPYTGFSAAGISYGTGTLADALDARTSLSTAEYAAHDDATDDADALEEAMAAAVQQGKTLIWGRGIARVSRPVVVPDGITIVACDETSGIRNVSAGINNLKAPFLLGNWHPAYLGSRALGSSEPFVSTVVDVYNSTTAVTETGTTLTLASAGAASNFTVGEVYPVVSTEIETNDSTGVELQVPIQQTALRLKARDTGANTLTFERPFGFTSSTAVRVVRFKNGASDNGLPIKIAQRIRIDGIKTYGFNAFGNNCMAIYDCRLTNFGGDVDSIIQANMISGGSVIDGYRGRYTGARVCEVKFGHSDGVIENIYAYNDVATTHAEGMFSIGEYARSLRVRNCQILAPKVIQPLFQMQPGYNCIFDNIEVFAPSSTVNPVVFYGDEGRPIEDCGLINCRITHNSVASVLIGTGTYNPRNCFVRRCTFRSAATTIAVSFGGGKGIEIVGNDFGKGKFTFSGATAEGCLVKDNITDTTTIDGAFAAQNNVETNYKREADDTLTPFGHQVASGFKAIGTYAGWPGAGVILDYTDNDRGFLRARNAAGVLQRMQIAATSLEFGTEGGVVFTAEAGVVHPNTTNTIDLGKDGQSFRDLWLSRAIHSPALTDAADDTAAGTAGVAVGQFYRTGSTVKVRVA